MTTNIGNVGMSKSLLRDFGGGLTSLYDSDNWEQPSWNRSTERSWKNHRSAQYRWAKPSAKSFFVLVADDSDVEE